MKFFQKISPEWSLRIGFGIMYLYSGFDLFAHPSGWQWVIPLWLKKIFYFGYGDISFLNAYLQFQGIVELIFAIVLLGWFFKTAIVKIVAILSSLEMALILAFAFLPWSEANFLITFRDIGLLGGAVALLAILLKKDR